jgi:hypothetical protein
VACVDPTEEIFQRVNDAPWVKALEQRLPKRLPVSYLSLIERYVFPSFDAAALSFFANTGTGSEDDLSTAIFQDPFIAELTLNAGYIQFARPSTGSYDPICFDTTRKSNNREFPIVRLAHEEILVGSRIQVVETMADSFYRFAVNFLSAD